MADEFTTLEHLPDALEKMLEDFGKLEYKERQEALDKASAFLKEKLEEDAASFRDTGEYARSFCMRTYPDHRYVGNSSVANGVVHRKGKDGKKGQARENVPLSNILEYAENSPHQGRIRRVFDTNRDKLLDIMLKRNYGGN